MRVLVHVPDVDDVSAPAGPPVQVHLAPALGRVLQDLERALVLALDVRAPQHLAADAQPEHVTRAAQRCNFSIYSTELD